MRVKLRGGNSGGRSLSQLPVSQNGGSVQVGLIIRRGMQRLLEREVQLHWPRRGVRRAMGLLPDLSSQRLELIGVLVVNPIGAATAKAATHRNEKLLLIHGLIGTTVLQPFGAVGGEQQQRLGRSIGFNGGRQQIRHSRSRGGHHCNAMPFSSCESKRQKRC